MEYVVEGSQFGAWHTLGVRGCPILAVSARVGQFVSPPSNVAGYDYDGSISCRTIPFFQ
jgi:hypothetical protein